MDNDMNKFKLMSISLIAASVGVSGVFLSYFGTPSSIRGANASEHGASCKWNHYDGVLPSTSEHGSHEFWACCTHPGYSLTKPTQGQITDKGEFTGTYFDNLDSADERYVPQLESAGQVDSLTPVTISDLGLASGTTVTTGHAFGTYDYNANKGIDLWFRFSYSVLSSDSWFYFYLFNGADENGIVCRIQTNRTADDGIVGAYIYTQNAYSGATTAVKGAGNKGTAFYFPRISGIKSTATNYLHATAYCLNESTNLYRCTFTAGVEGGTQYYPSTNAEDLTNTPISFDIELGAGFFDSGARSKVRFSTSTNDNNFTISDISSCPDTSVVYKDANNNVIGKLTDQTTYSLPTISLTDKRFIGWFDGKGERVKNGDPVTGKAIVTPRFIDETGGDMFTLSDYGFETSGAWLERDPSSGENISSRWVTTENSSYDVYFIHQRTSFDAGEDCYSVFGLPYDGIDAQTRMSIRLDERANAGLRGYIYGAGTIGGAGASTAFSLGETTRTMSGQLLIHVKVEDRGSNEFAIRFEAMDLATGLVSSPGVKSSTFSTDMGLSEEFGPRNKFGLVYNCHCSTRVTDAF